MPGVKGIGRACRIYARSLYRALSVEDIRHRRATSETLLMRRLLLLDYVLEHPDLPWLPTEPEKIGAFEALGINTLPVHRTAAPQMNLDPMIPGFPAVRFRFSHHRDTIGPDIVQRQERQIVQSRLNLRDFLP